MMSRIAMATILVLAGSSCWATPVEFRMDILISDCHYYVNNNPTTPPCDPGDLVHVGGIYTGYFSIDSTVLASDGQVDSEFLTFRLALGDNVWDMSIPPSGPVDQFGLPNLWSGSSGVQGATGQTFWIHDGQIVGMCCGVHSWQSFVGLINFPFVDWGGDPYNAEDPQSGLPGLVSVVAYRSLAGYLTGAIYYNIVFEAEGQVTVTQVVPIPTTVSLLSTALAMVGWRQIRRRAPREGISM